MSTELIMRILALGYLLGGYFTILKVISTPPIDRPGFMINPSGIKVVLLVIIWPFIAFTEAYYLHMPKKANSIIYGIVTTIVMWLGFSAFSALIILPHLYFDSSLVSIIVSVVMFLVGQVIFMPIITIICTTLTIVIAKPITLLFSKGG